jgi:regulator of protease activity HflC (stomatin/prohibitin superfamily)
MNRQMAAERERRAAVIEAEGKRAAAITVAEGEKQAAILKAEGERQAHILEAEGGRQAQILQAEGYSTALNTINGAARTLDEKAMGLQYLDALKNIGEGQSTKFIFPMEFTGLLRAFRTFAGGNGADGGAPPP